MIPGEDKEFSWTVQTHEHRERSTDWYWTIGVIALVGAGVSIYFGNVLFAVIMLLGLGSIGFLAARGPREHGVRIDERGISIDGTRYPYASIQSFWIERGVAEPTLFISMNGVLSPHFSLPLANKDDAVKLHQHLIRFIQEEEQGPHFGEHVARLFGL